jgi:hypothetical protein
VAAGATEMAADAAPATVSPSSPIEGREEGEWCEPRQALPRHMRSSEARVRVELSAELGIHFAPPIPSRAWLCSGLAGERLVRVWFGGDGALE